jgi:rubrerythrin
METQFVVCIQCGQEFEFPPDEQARYLDRGFDAPRRCPSCRRKKSKYSGNGPERRRNGKKRDYRMKYE